MLKLDSPIRTLAVASAAALAIALTMSAMKDMRAGTAHAADPAPAAAAQWAASATGRVEPKDGEVRVAPQVAGLIVDVPVETGAKVLAGDLLVKLDDADLRARLLSARAEAEVREREREEEPATKGIGLDRRKAQDDVAKAERAVFAAQQAFDLALAIERAGNGKADDVAAARQKLAQAKAAVIEERTRLTSIEQSDEVPLMTRLETALEQARADISQLETAIERTRIRAPADGTVLTVNARAGELAAPAAETPLVMFGNVTSLRVRAELEEREVVKVRAGQAVVVRVDAYPDQDFPGTVSSIAASLSTPKIVARGPRRPSDVEVLEVLVALDGKPPLIPGMRVDVFFKNDGPQQQSAAPSAVSVR